MNALRKSAVVTALIGVLLVAGTMTLLVSHWSYVSAAPLILLWIALSLVAGFALFHFNRADLRLRGPVLALVGYGILATIGSFALQSLVNGWLSAALGESASTFSGAAILGFGSGFCQTLGKTVAIWLVLRSLRPETLPEILAVGLAVGLGFGLAEVLLIADQTIAHELKVTSLMGVVERASAQGFHIYSGALIALGIGFRRWWTIGAVLVIHSAMDTLAGGFAHGLSILLLELMFAMIALATWGGYLAVLQSVRTANGT